MLEAECDATATFLGTWLTQALAQSDVTNAALGVCVASLANALHTQVCFTKARAMREIEQGRRSLSVVVSGAAPSAMVLQAISAAGFDGSYERLAALGERTFLLFAGYVLVRDAEQSQVLYPAIQATLEAIEQAFASAPPTSQGRFIACLSSDGRQRCILHKSYPAYYVYEVLTRGEATRTWQSSERVGNDRVIALIASAYHKGHWFARQKEGTWGSLHISERH